MIDGYDVGGVGAMAKDGAGFPQARATAVANNSVRIRIPMSYSDDQRPKR